MIVGDAIVVVVFLFSLLLLLFFLSFFVLASIVAFIVVFVVAFVVVDIKVTLVEVARRRLSIPLTSRQKLPKE